RQRAGWGDFFDAGALTPPGSAFGRSTLPIKGRDGVCDVGWSKQMWVELRLNAVADRDDGFHVVLAQSIDLPHAETQREGVLCLRYRASRNLSARLKRAVPQTVIDIDLARLDAMIDRTAYDLRRCIETHGLGVEQRRGEGSRVMAFEPG